jgi:thymidylate synthase
MTTRSSNFALGLTPQPGEAAPCGDLAWRFAMRRILEEGHHVAPRGQPTKELLHEQLLTVDLTRAVVTSPARKLSSQFMAADALWICDGRRDLAALTPYAPSMSRFSDDGVTLYGAYGPRIASQLEHVVTALTQDRDTRQAVLTIWERNPPPSKDLPCTVAMSFSIRKDRLFQHVYMRSSDVWLGVPYDMFSFSCVGLLVTCLHNRVAQVPVRPGHLTISMTSSHLYLKNEEAAKAVLETDPLPEVEPVPEALVLEGRWDRLRERLVEVRDGTGAFSWGSP